jgi:hypothetical protein
MTAAGEAETVAKRSTSEFQTGKLTVMLALRSGLRPGIGILGGIAIPASRQASIKSPLRFVKYCFIAISRINIYSQIDTVMVLTRRWPDSDHEICQWDKVPRLFQSKLKTGIVLPAFNSPTQTNHWEVECDHRGRCKGNDQLIPPLPFPAFWDA